MEPVATRSFPGLHHPVVKPQEVETLRSLPKIHDPGLVGMQVQPEWFQGRFSQVTSLLGSFLSRTEDHEIIAITNQRS